MESFLDKVILNMVKEHDKEGYTAQEAYVEVFRRFPDCMRAG